MEPWQVFPGVVMAVIVETSIISLNVIDTDESIATLVVLFDGEVEDTDGADESDDSPVTNPVSVVKVEDSSLPAISVKSGKIWSLYRVSDDRVEYGAMVRVEKLLPTAGGFSRRTQVLKPSEDN